MFQRAEGERCMILFMMNERKFCEHHKLKSAQEIGNILGDREVIFAAKFPKFQ